MNKHNDYSHYIIIPHFVDGGSKAYEIINTLPKDKLILLDKIERADTQSANGDVISEEELEKEMEKWFK